MSHECTCKLQAGFTAVDESYRCSADTFLDGRDFPVMDAECVIVAYCTSMPYAELVADALNSRACDPEGTCLVHRRS